MITMSKENGRNMNRCRNSRDDSDRLMAQKQKERMFFHSFLHKRCKLCSTKFIPGYCPNCCSPVSQKKKKTKTFEFVTSTSKHHTHTHRHT